MKTNTTKLRRALTAFAMTGAMLPLSNLFAADIAVGPNQTYTTVGAVGKAQLNGNTVILSGNTVESLTISYEYFDSHSPAVTLKSDSDAIRTIDLNGSGRLLYHNTYESATILNGENIIITNGVHETNGGAVAAAGALTVNGNIIFEGNRINSGTTGGGAVYGNEGNLTIDGTHTFNNNYSDYYDGAVFLDYNSTYTMTITGENTFTNNTAGWSGGAVYTDSGSMVISGKNTFKENSAKYAGAVGVRNATNSSLTISGENTFKGNSATQGEGGAIKAEAVDKITITGTNDFLNNTAVTGGAIFAQKSTMEISGINKFSENSVTGEGKSGGAITAQHIIFSGKDSKAIFTDNTANGKGNDIYIRQPLKTYNFCKTIIQNPEFLGISVF